MSSHIQSFILIAQADNPKSPQNSPVNLTGETFGLSVPLSAEPYPWHISHPAAPIGQQRQRIPLLDDAQELASGAQLPAYKPEARAEMATQRPARLQGQQPNILATAPVPALQSFCLQRQGHNTQVQAPLLILQISPALGEHANQTKMCTAITSSSHSINGILSYFDSGTDKDRGSPY